MPLDYPLAMETLPNGLRVVVSEDHSVPEVAVNLWVGVGSADEAPGRTGFAHLFEHLMFEGSANVAEGEHFRLLQGVGGRANATTWVERTNYFESVPTGALELALWLEADRHQNLLTAVTQENLDNQRAVVTEEKRERYDDTPYGSAMIDVFATVFPPGHPFAHPTIGSLEDLAAASLTDVHDFYRAHYHPQGTVLTLAGDVTAEQGTALARRYFGQIPAAADPAPVRTVPALAPLEAPRRLVRREDVPLDRLYLGWRLPREEASSHELLACELALDVIGGLYSSRLYKGLVRTDLAHHVGGSVIGLASGCSLGVVSVECSEDRRAEDVEAALLAELERLAAEGPTAVEIEASLADTERHWLSAMAVSSTRADLISREVTLHGDPGRINTYLDRLGAVTAEEVRQAVASWLRPEQRATVAYLAPRSTSWPQEGR